MVEKIALDLSYLKYPLPEELGKELEEEIKKVNLYPSGDYDKLRRKFAEYVKVKKENILPGNGLDEVIDLITRAWKGKILIPLPTFSQFEIAANREGSEKILVDCFKNNTYSIGYSKEHLSEASLVWICNPNNPTGDQIPREKIIYILKESRGMVAVDECYYEYSGETVIDLIDEFNNLIVLRSFSKNFGLAGLRLGFAISASGNIKKLESFRQIFNVNRIAEKLGEKVLDYISYYQGIWEEIKSTRGEFIEKIKQIGFKPYDSYTNFVLVEFKNRKEAERAWKNLKKKGIYTFPAWSEEFSGLEGNFIRFTVGTEKEMNKTIEVLSTFKR